MSQRNRGRNPKVRRSAKREAARWKRDPNGIPPASVVWADAMLYGRGAVQRRFEE